MKNRKVFFAAVCIAALGLGSCFSSWNGEIGKGTISINLGSNGARVGLTTDTETDGTDETKDEKAAMVYTITLSPAEEAEETEKTEEAERPFFGPFTGGKVTIAVSPGDWNIIVTAYLSEEEYEAENPYAEGKSEEPVTVRAGENSPVSIRMEVIGGGDSSGEINVEIKWSNIPEDILEDISCTITVTNTGGDYDSQTREEVSFNEPVYFTVKPGEWTVDVEAFIAGVPRAYGETPVEVKTGKTVTASVVMSEVTKVVRTWEDLKDVFEKNTGQNEIVIITDNLDANDSMNLTGRSWNITLLAEKDVTITKSGAIQNSLFRVLSGCELTLGGIGQGTITIDGGGYGASSLIVVQANGELIMHNGITLKNNQATISDRGGGVTVDGGTFTMNGGVISGNTTITYGGGVRILSGSFIKTGGIIYGSNGGDNQNTATNEGHAVYAGSDYVRNTTSGPGNVIYFVPDEDYFSGWDNNPDIPNVPRIPGAVIDLGSSQWYDDFLSAGEEHYYQFYAEPGKGYYIRWNDIYEGDGTKTVDIEVTARWKGADNTIFQKVDSAYETPRHIPPSASGGYIILMLEAYYYSSSSGTYAIGYYPAEGPNLPLVVPDAVIELGSSAWRDNSLSTGEMHYYRFYAEPGKGYYVTWNDSYQGDSTKTVNIEVTARWETTGYPIFKEVDSGFRDPRRIAPSTSGGYIILMVKGYSSSSGTYAIQYYPAENSP